MRWLNRKGNKSKEGHEVGPDGRQKPTLEELLATCNRAGTRVSDLKFAGSSSESSIVAFLLVPPEDASEIVSAMKKRVAEDSQISDGKRQINRVDASVMLHYREDMGGDVKYLFADFIITIRDVFNKSYRILANDNIPFFEALAKSGILGIIPSEIPPSAVSSSDMSDVALVQMPNRQILEELLAEVKSKVGTPTN
ncbi:MAG TPA: hypothetical protein VNI77_01920 [Nitrososphaera sp.]|nr:hypothetical protein [Nitrososphaera sp.]